MELFLQTALSFPTAIYSFLLCVAVIYWLVVAAGLLEVDLLDFHAIAPLLPPVERKDRMQFEIPVLRQPS